MSMITGGATITTVEASRGAMQSEQFKSRMALVKSFLRNGAISERPDDQAWGGEGHIAAIASIMKECRSLLREIETYNKENPE